MRRTNRTVFLWVLGLGSSILLSSTRAQQVPAAVPPSPAIPAAAEAAAERAQLENYIRVMTAELARAETRARAATTELVTLDGDIESRVSRLVSMLAQVRDSTDSSSTRIRREKDDVIEGLKATAAYYAQERDRRKKERENSYAQITDDELAKDVAALNARIEVRVTQALDLAASLSQTVEGPVDRHRYEDVDYGSETTEYRRAQRDASASAKIKADLAADLRASIEKLSRDIQTREGEFRATTDPEKRERISTDIQTMRQTIESRRAQMASLVTAPAPATRPVGTKGAFELEKMIEEMIADLKGDFAKFKALVQERDVARARIAPIKNRLERATAALAAMGPASVPSQK